MTLMQGNAHIGKGTGKQHNGDAELAQRKSGSGEGAPDGYMHVLSPPHTPQIQRALFDDGLATAICCCA